jgi:glycogen synthase
MNIIYLVKNFTDGDELSEYVKSLAEYASIQGHKACVISFDDGSHYTVSDDVEVERFELHFDGDSLYTWTMMMNNEMKARVIDKIDEEEIDIIHANDWTTIPGGLILSKTLEKPFFLTIHSTENQRGFQGDNSELISDLEWEGTFEADLVFANNHEVKNSLLFDIEIEDENVCVADPLSDNWKEEILNQYKSKDSESIEVEVEN